MLESILDAKGWKNKYNIADQLPELQVKTGIIWGKEDAFESPGDGFPKMANIPDHKFEVVEDAGHCPWLDQPGKCAALVLSMLNESTSYAFPGYQQLEK